MSQEFCTFSRIINEAISIFENANFDNLTALNIDV